MVSLTLALIVVCVVALAVASTRLTGLLCLAVLVRLHPVLFLVLLLVAGGAYLYVQKRRDR